MLHFYYPVECLFGARLMQLCYICYIMLHKNVTRQRVNWTDFNTVHEEMLHKSKDILYVKLPVQHAYDIFR